jgi:arabinose-5-phosphate isomerase
MSLDDRSKRMRDTLRRESRILSDLADCLDAGAGTAAGILLGTQGHVFVGGAGTSNAVAQRFAHLLSCCGCPAVFVHAADSWRGSPVPVGACDTVVLISKGGKTAEVNAFARFARERGARVIAFTEDLSSELGQLSDCIVRIHIDPGSDPFGMVATSSSLANAAVADAICETILVESGYSLNDFGATHPSGAVGQRIKRRDSTT